MNLMYIEPIFTTDTYWDVSDNPPERRHHHEINAALYPGQRTCWSSVGGALLAAEEYQPRLIITLLPMDAGEVGREQAEIMRRVVRSLKRPERVLATILDDISGSFLNADIPTLIAMIELINEHDCAFPHADWARSAVSICTKIPVFRWRDASEICIRQAHLPYPEETRDCITVANPYVTRQRHNRGGAHNYFIARAILDSFPDYRFRIAANNLTPDFHDDLLDYLGLSENMILPPREWSWESITDAYVHSALVINLDGARVRGQVNYEAAACGAVPITTRIPDSGKDLGLAVETELCLSEALQQAEALLSDPILWDVESRRVHALSKQFTLDATRRNVDHIFRALGKPRP